MKNESLFLCFHPHCTLTKGYTKSLIINLLAQDFWVVSNEWDDLCNQLMRKSVAEVKLNLHNSTLEIERLIQFLTNKQIAYYSTTPHHSMIINDQPLNLKSPFDLHTLTVDLNTKNLALLQAINFFSIQLKTLTLSINKSINPNHLALVLRDIQTTAVNLEGDFEHYSLFKEICALTRIDRVYLKNAPFCRHFSFNSASFYFQTHFPNYKNADFRVDHHLFTIAQDFHSYFYKRAHIKENGTITNAPTCKQSYGNIYQKSLANVVQSRNFKQLWYAKKADIDICFDCHLRFICEDTRPLNQRANGSWYATQECFYNPYLDKEKEQRNYLSLADCGITSNGKGFHLDIETFIRARTYSNLFINQIK